MAIRRLKRPRDPIQLGKLIVDIATGQVEDRVEDGKNPVAVESGQRGGRRGGLSRASSLTPEKRRQIARNAAIKRWSKQITGS